MKTLALVLVIETGILIVIVIVIVGMDNVELQYATRVLTFEYWCWCLDTGTSLTPYPTHPTSRYGSMAPLPLAAPANLSKVAYPSFFTPYPSHPYRFSLTHYQPIQVAHSAFHLYTFYRNFTNRVLNHETSSYCVLYFGYLLENAGLMSDSLLGVRFLVCRRIFFFF